MSFSSATASHTHSERYESLLRAANAIATCRDCDTAGAVLVRELSRAVSFDYLGLTAVCGETNRVAWRLLHTNGKTINDDLQNKPSLDGTPLGWVHEVQQLLVTQDWQQETRFSEHRQFLNGIGIASTCILPLARGERKLGVLSLGKSRRCAYRDEEVHFLCLEPFQ